jgi:hypothetical protein
MRGRAARRQGVLGWLGTLSGAAGIGIVAASALLGAVITVVQRQDPGAVLGVLLVGGTIVAGFAVRTRSVRLIIPAPVFCYVPTAVVAGAINDRSVDTSKIGLIIHGGKWISSGFTAMTVATIAAIVITGLRLFLDFRGRPRRPRTAQPGRAGQEQTPRGQRPLVKDRFPAGQGDDLDGLTRPIGQVGPAPTGPIGGPAPTGPVGGPADGRGSGPWRQPPGSGGYPQQPGPGGHPQQPPGPGPYPQPQGTTGHPRPPGSGPYPQPQPPRPGQQQGGGPYPPQRGLRTSGYSFSSGA